MSTFSHGSILCCEILPEKENDPRQDKNNTSGNIFFLLFLTFMILKLCNVIDWSWWLVAGPLWMPFALLFTVLFLEGLSSQCRRR